jgi:hypothetical protein
MTKKELIKKLWNIKGESIEFTKNGSLPTFEDFEKQLTNIR